MKRTWQILLIYALPLLLCAACTSYLRDQNTSGVESRTSSEKELLREQVAQSALVRCSPVAQKIELPAPVRVAQLVFQGNQPALVWEGVFRDAIKSVWQGLGSSLAQEGDGLVIGEKDKKWVVDFRMQEVGSQLWTSYRFRLAGAQTFGAMVEYLDVAKKKSALMRLRLPLGAAESVQQVWLLPSQTNEGHYAVVRINRADAKGTEGDDDSSYVLFQLNPISGKVRRVAQRDEVGHSFGAAQFVVVGNSIGDVLALGVEQLAPVGVTGRSRFRLVVRRLFSQKYDSFAIWEAPRPIANLVIRESAEHDLFMAWLLEPQDQTYPELYWAELTKQSLRLGRNVTNQTNVQQNQKNSSKISPPEKTKFNKNAVQVPGPSWRTWGQDSVVNLFTTRAYRLNQFPSQLTFFPLMGGKSSDLMLAWRVDSGGEDFFQLLPLRSQMGTQQGRPYSVVYDEPRWSVLAALEARGAGGLSSSTSGTLLMIEKQSSDKKNSGGNSESKGVSGAGSTQRSVLRFCRFDLSQVEKAP